MLRGIGHSLLAVSAVALCFWAAGFLYYLNHVNAYTSAPDDTAEAIVVLTGGPQRVNTGFNLLAEHHSEKLLISGVNKKVSAETLLSLWKEGRADRIEPACCITIGHEARNTRENAREAAAWIRNNNITSISLVTADYHLPRAELEFRSILPHVRITPYAVKSSRPRPQFALNEYNKTLWRWIGISIFGPDQI
jgi:uncharacterized SAM-binding protein YcdF (DUF218 family)